MNIKPPTGAPGWLRTALWVAAALAIIVVTVRVQLMRAAAPDPVTARYQAMFGGPFTLTDTNGNAVTEAMLKGRPHAIFFGFTRCPDVCPTTLDSLARLYAKLGPERERLRIVFVSVDPGHDTPAGLKEYLSMFAVPVTGLTGTPAQLAQIQKGYGVYVRKVPLPGGDYTIDHTAAIYLMDANGGFAGTIGHDESDTVKLEKLRKLLTQQ